MCPCIKPCSLVYCVFSTCLSLFNDMFLLRTICERRPSGLDCVANVATRPPTHLTTPPRRLLRNPTRQRKVVLHGTLGRNQCCVATPQTRKWPPQAALSDLCRAPSTRAAWADWLACATIWHPAVRSRPSKVNQPRLSNLFLSTS